MRDDPENRDDPGYLVKVRLVRQSDGDSEKVVREVRQKLIEIAREKQVTSLSASVQVAKSTVVQAKTAPEEHLETTVNAELKAALDHVNNGGEVSATIRVVREKLDAAKSESAVRKILGGMCDSGWRVTVAELVKTLLQ